MLWIKSVPKAGKDISTPRKIVGAILVVILMTAAFGFAQGWFLAFEVNSESMYPTINTGDCLLVDTRQPFAPKVGDIVAVKNPEDPVSWLCKRIVAVPNDQVRFIKCRFYRNGRLQSTTVFLPGDKMDEFGNLNLQLDYDEYFVMGDNQADSHDSRDFGPVHASDLIGRVTRIYWPLNRVQSLSQEAQDYFQSLSGLGPGTRQEESMPPTPQPSPRPGH
ncbi:MAG TPA: signal peptidase I [Candidatus Sumerlaeota bacterium]|nr:signal peptidase I [Candidatus Sumerlaeota bacterium]HPS00012.1 signal peptidase I [Candidatus Sumerlaeota bacterium]